MESATRLVDERLDEKGFPVRERPQRAFEQGKCYACHRGVELQAGVFAGVNLKHEVHLLRAGLSCAACHRPHGERGPHEVVRFGKEGCVTCHHKAAKRECTSCHPAASLAKEIAFGNRTFSHKLHLEEAGLTCPDCHVTAKDGAVSLNREACASCHED
ncbi:MAG: cytochrome c3 family protein [Acidobacteriota bacterium]